MQGSTPLQYVLVSMLAPASWSPQGKTQTAWPAPGTAPASPVRRWRGCPAPPRTGWPAPFPLWGRCRPAGSWWGTAAASFPASAPRRRGAPCSRAWCRRSRSPDCKSPGRSAPAGRGRKFGTAPSPFPGRCTRRPPDARRLPRRSPAGFRSALSASSGSPFPPRRHRPAAASHPPRFAPLRTGFQTWTPPARSIRRPWHGKCSGTGCMTRWPFRWFPPSWSACSPFPETASRRRQGYAFSLASLRLWWLWGSLPFSGGIRAISIA